jgi:hypothetical protein
MLIGMIPIPQTAPPIKLPPAPRGAMDVLRLAD